MKGDIEFEMKSKNISIFETICRYIVLIFFMALMGTVCYFSFRWTWLNFMESEQEYSEVCMPPVRDGMKQNILFFLLVVLLLSVLVLLFERLLSGREFPVWLSFVLAAVGTLLCVWCALMLQSRGRADSGYVIDIAGQILKGDYGAFNVRTEEYYNAYLSNYPQQITMVWFYTILIPLFGGDGAQSAFHMINAIATGVFLFFGERTLHLMWKRAGISLLFYILSFCCVPIYFYSGYAYGEMISTGLAMAVVYLLMRTVKEGRISVIRTVLMFLLATVAAGFRTNIVILYIAMMIVTFVVAVSSKRFRLFILIPVLMVSCVFMNLLLGNTIYRNVEKTEGFPAISWINIGLHYGSGFGIGGYDGMIYRVFEENNYDHEAFREECSQMVKEQLAAFWEDKEKGSAFFLEKLRWQWIDPTFQCFVHTSVHKPGYPKGLIYDVMYGKLRNKTHTLMDRYQSLIYLLSLLGMIRLFMKKAGFEGWIWSIYIIGGFLFSLMWEAKPRYCFPYYVYMMPLCAYGLYMVPATVRKLAGALKDRRKNGNE